MLHRGNWVIGLIVLVSAMRYFSSSRKASRCPACLQELSTMAGLHEQWSKHDVELVFVSLDEDNEAFRNYVGGLPFISICDYQKWESPVVKAFRVFATPTIYLLDSERKILLRPNSVRQMDSGVDWFLVQGNL